MKTNENIVLYPNHTRDIDLKLTTQAAVMLMDAGFSVILGYHAPLVPTIGFLGVVKAMPLIDCVRSARLIVTFGGDGTILHAANAAYADSVPIIGVNLGHKGFLAELKPCELDKLIEVSAGNYEPDTRMMLDVRLIRNGRVIYSDTALNDAVVRKLSSTEEFEILSDGRCAVAFKGNGIIAATPTGSTAYSLAAGGPIVEPDTDNILLTAICPCSTSVRPYVLSGRRKVTIVPQIGSVSSVVLSVDGREEVTVLEGDRVYVERSKYSTVLARVAQEPTMKL